MASRTLTTSGETIFDRSRLRKSMVILNEDSAIPLFVKREAPGVTIVSSTNHDHKIGPGGALSLNSVLDGVETIQERWTIVAESGTPRVSFFETEDVIR